MKLWKKWPYWLKGGLIAVGITLICMALGYSCEVSAMPGPESGAGCVFTPFFIPMLPAAFLSDTNPFFNKLPNIYLLIATILLWFGIGALIGAVHGWGKSKKKKSNS